MALGSRSAKASSSVSMPPAEREKSRRSLGEAPRDVVYETYSQTGNIPMFHFVVRAADPGRVSVALIAAAQEIDSSVQVFQSTTMAKHLAMSRLPSQMGAFMLSAFVV